MLSSLYLGTDTYCWQWTGYYTMGACSGKSGKKGRTIYGFSDTNLYSFGGSHLCYLRSETENYHTIASQRMVPNEANPPTCGDGEKVCGPANITLEDTYCSKEDKCPLDGLYALAKQNGTNPSTSNSYATVAYNSNWNLYLQN